MVLLLSLPRTRHQRPRETKRDGEPPDNRNKNTLERTQGTRSETKTGTKQRNRQAEQGTPADTTGGKVNPNRHRETCRESVTQERQGPAGKLSKQERTASPISANTPTRQRRAGCDLVHRAGLKTDPRSTPGKSTQLHRSGAPKS